MERVQEETEVAKGIQDEDKIHFGELGCCSSSLVVRPWIFIFLGKGLFIVSGVRKKPELRSSRLFTYQQTIPLRAVFENKILSEKFSPSL
jgi:hypothetical protein